MTKPFVEPPRRSQGPRRIDAGNVRWQLWAPFCDHIDLLTWSDGVAAEAPMTALGDGYFSHQMATDAADVRYAFRLSPERIRPDPASRWQPAGVHEPSALFFPEDFAWTDQDWPGIPWDSMVLYELHVGTFTPEGTFEAVVQRLPELVALGVTAIEIMPVSQFSGQRNWGYDGVHPFAVQNSYGGPLELQRLVDAAHHLGMAVVLDVVYNHLGPEGNYLTEFGPYFNDRHHTPWGVSVNFDGPHSDAVRQFVIDNATYWIRDFHLDGLRLDAVQTMVDDGARHILAEIQSEVQSVARQQQRQVCVIAETNQNDSRLTNPVTRGGYQLDGFWADDLHHSLHAWLTDERDGYYVDFGTIEHIAKVWERGLAYDGCYSHFRRRRHGNSATETPRSCFVVGIQNHDQVGNRFDSARIATLASAAQQRLAAALVLLSPFTPLLFMGEEYGETAPFPYFCGFLDRALNRAVARGRRRDFDAAGFAPRDGLRPAHSKKTFESAVLSWSWQQDPGRRGLRQLYGDLLAARKHWRPLREHLPATCKIVEEEILVIRYPQQPDYQIVVNFGSESRPLPAVESPREKVLFSSQWSIYGGPQQKGAPTASLEPLEVVVWGPDSWLPFNDG